MKSRTQPFRIGRVLEVPPTWLVLQDDPRHWEPRAFAPHPTVGDPVSGMAAPRSGRPRVASYVSHSFQFLKATRDRSPEALARFEARLEAKFPPAEAKRLTRTIEGNMRVHDGRLDEGAVAAAAGILRRVSERPDARCVTLAELAELHGGPLSDIPPATVDPVPALDRRQALSSTLWMRRQDAAVPEHPSELPVPEMIEESTGLSIPATSGGRGRVANIEGEGFDGDPGGYDRVNWPRGFERCAPIELGDRLDRAAALLRPGGTLWLGISILGYEDEPGQRPALAHLTSAAAARSGTSWDASTFIAWFRRRGFETVEELRREHDPGTLAELKRHRDCLSGLSEAEIRVRRLEVGLRPASSPQTVTSDACVGPPWVVEIDSLDASAAEFAASFRPGEQREVLFREPGGVASRTTVLVAMMRSGLHILEATPIGSDLALELTRPLELDEVREMVAAGIPPGAQADSSKNAAQGVPANSLDSS
jgi:hypothetical protein